MFKKLTKFIINQLDPYKELVPVESIAYNEHFRPLYLLKKKRKSKTIFHPAPYYQQTGFTLHDVLLPGEDGKSTESLLQDSSHITLTKTSADQTDGGLSISFDPASVDLQGGASLAKEFSITPQKKSISPQSLEALKKERQINMDHSFIQQVQERAIDLYVVTEILEASEETVYKESTKANRGFKAKFHATLCAKSTREDKQTIVIPKGCTLAFKTMMLHIRNGAWHIDYFPEEALRKEAYTADGPSQGKLRVVVSEVKYSCRIFPELSPDLLLVVFNTIKAVMTDKNLFQELRQKMEEILEQNDGYELQTESPDLKDLFSNLQHSSRDCLLLLAEGITYILDALHGEALRLQEGNQGRVDSQTCHSLPPSTLTPFPPQVESTSKSHGGERREIPSTPTQGSLLPQSAVTASAQGPAPISALVTMDRTQANVWSCVWEGHVGYQGKVLIPEGAQALNRLPGNGHSPKADRAPGVFGQLSQAHSGIVGVVLCRDRSWTSIILVGPFQIHIL